MEQGAQPAMVEVAERPGPARLGIHGAVQIAAEHHSHLLGRVYAGSITPDRRRTHPIRFARHVTCSAGRRSAADWRRVVVVFWITSMVEGLGVSQVFAFLPPTCGRSACPTPIGPPFVGLFSALIFVVGMPLVPLWGVWADKYSRKAVVVRSALVEARRVRLRGALSREPWQLALSMLLIGFQLGNTGVMLGAIRDVVPRQRVGHDDRDLRRRGADRVRPRAVPRRHAHRRAGLGLSSVFWLSAALSVGTARARLVRLARGPARRSSRRAGSSPLAYGALRERPRRPDRAPDLR